MREKRPSKSHDNIQRNENRFVWSSLFKKEIIKTESAQRSEEVQNNVTTGATSSIIHFNSRVVESPSQVSYLDLLKGE